MIRKLIELVDRPPTAGAARYNLAVANGGAPAEMEVLRHKLTAALPDYDHIWSGELDGTLSVYIGDGVLGGRGAEAGTVERRVEIKDRGQEDPVAERPWSS